MPSGLLPASVLSFERAYGLSHDQMGRIVGLCMVAGGGVGGLLGGWTCGRVGALRNMLLAFVGSAASLGLVGLTRSLPVSVGGLVGYFFSMGFMASSNVLATLMLPDTQRGVSLLHAVNAIGKLAGPMLAAIFLHDAWRNSFVAVAVFSLVMMVPALLVHANGNTTAGKKNPSTPRPGLAFWAAVVGFGLIAGSEIAVALWLPTFGKMVRGYTTQQANALLSAFLLGLMAGRFASGGLSRVLSSTRAIAVCGGCLLFVVPALLSQGFGPSAVFFFLFGLAFSATWPSYFAHMSTVFPEHLGLMGGAALLSTQIGFAACSYVSGRLAETSPAYPTIFGAVVMGVFVLVFFASPLCRCATQGER